VYAVGHARPTREGRWRAAVLACGPGAVLSHRDAAALHGIRPSARRRIDVTTARRGRTGPKEIDLHRVRNLHPDDVTTVDGIPVTTVARTLVDLAEVVSREAVEKAVNEAEVRRLLDVRAVTAALARANGRRRAAVLRRAIARAADTPPTKHELQRRFRRLCHDAGLPPPTEEAGITIDGRRIEVDFLWPDRRLIVETDGAATHMTRKAFHDDRSRDVALTVAGYRVLRFTWDDITRRPDEVVRALRTLLSAR
jgi:hypothetical protein